MTKFWKHWYAIGLAGLLVLVGGIGQRLSARALGAELEAPVQLPRPLASLPLVLGSWSGEDVPLSAAVRRIAMNDDFVNRRYYQRQTGATVSLYVAYTARPRTMLRHRPTVCYASAGWAHLDTHETLLELPAEAPSGSGPRPCTWPVLVHRFLRPGPTGDTRIVVLNFYVLNGRPTVDEDSFWGLRWRGPNLRRDVTQYVAQVQIAATVDVAAESAERDVCQFARAAAEDLQELLPGAAEHWCNPVQPE